MESLVERLFRETYELDEIPDPHGGSPYPLRTPELIPQSSPLVELAHRSDPEWLEWDTNPLLWATPRDYSSGPPEATPPALPLVTQASCDSDPHSPQILRGSVSPSASGMDGGIRWVIINDSR
jgi:hypothetical protein